MQLLPNIEPRIASFRANLRTMDYQKVVQKHITLGDCYALDRSQHYDLMSEVATHFSLHPNDVIVVGSAKLGFSIAEGKRYRPFCDTSDIDLAIVSSELFDDLWQAVFEYWEEVGPGEYWTREKQFKHYLFRGWIRPDMLPSPTSFPKRLEWFEFFRLLTNSGRYGPFKINAGLYKSRYFLEKYQGICVRQCQQEEV